LKHSKLQKRKTQELRDRWMEEVVSGRLLIEGSGKYDVSRLIESTARKSLGALPAPIAA
jgi:hypothetical protein